LLEKVTYTAHLKSNETKILKGKSRSSGKEFIMKIIQNIPHRTLSTCYTSLLIAESILEISPKLSP
jgi:hypothetical protein